MQCKSRSSDSDSIEGIVKMHGYTQKKKTIDPILISNIENDYIL